MGLAHLGLLHADGQKGRSTPGDCLGQLFEGIPCPLEIHMFGREKIYMWLQNIREGIGLKKKNLVQISAPQKGIDGLTCDCHGTRLRVDVRWAVGEGERGSALRPLFLYCVTPHMCEGSQWERPSFGFQVVALWF